GDNKYMRAMRLVSGFFASFPHCKLHERADAFRIETANEWPWFFLRQEQLFIFLQDPIHLVVKWRTRLLSQRAELRIGNGIICIQHLQNILKYDNYTKLDHGMTKSDINPKDRQNHRSCVKLTSDDVLNILNEETDANGTLLYLTLLKMIITSYIEKSTSIEKLYSIYCKIDNKKFLTV
ncbi:unnamed protein product, partial [Didymodactylos carnosus]